MAVATLWASTGYRFVAARASWIRGSRDRALARRQARSQGEIQRMTAEKRCSTFVKLRLIDCMPRVIIPASRALRWLLRLRAVRIRATERARKGRWEPGFEPSSEIGPRLSRWEADGTE